MPTRLLGFEPVSQRRIYAARLGAFSVANSELSLPPGKFACLVLADASAVSAVALSEFCRSLLEQGCAYLCAWGPDCERVHDAMDMEYLRSSQPAAGLGVVMTTWHERNSLEEAVEFFLYNTLPDEDFAPDGCSLAVVISIANAAWAGAAERPVRAAVAAP